ncbi:MAG: type VI-D CRISPR-associated RNA-guided ribonuclease Cas13d [Lachnospirales bacterium]
MTFSTTLINKFDNIRSFIEVMEEMSLKCEFMEEYKFFNESKDICLRLKEIHSFARMKRPLDNKNVEKEMYKDAISILMKDSSIENSNIDVIFNTYIYQKDNKNAKKDFRNFIIKNVIKSNRFIYLIKYSNPTNVRKFASNTNVIKFVLGTLPDKQLERYYKSCGLSGGIGKTEWVRGLSEIITGIDYSDFLNVKQRAKSREEKEDKAKKQAIVTLYLTILYILTKNLVNVNSRYVIAVHCLERDSELYKTELETLEIERKESDKEEKKKIDEKLKLTQYFLNEKFFDRKRKNKKYGEYISEKITKYIEMNIENCENCLQQCVRKTNILVRYRNNIAHLNSIKNATKYVDNIGRFTSYFQLYNYIMQCDLKNWVKLKKEKEDGVLNTYFNDLEKYHTYVKDFVKALNVPFAYNYSRFKNLSIDELFDKNDTRQKE